MDGERRFIFIRKFIGAAGLEKVFFEGDVSERLNNAWALATAVLKPEIAEKHRSSFNFSFKWYLDALDVLDDRVLFYQGVLDKGNNFLKSKGLPFIKVASTPKLGFALSETYSNAVRIIGAINDALRQFPTFCYDFERRGFDVSVEGGYRLFSTNSSCVGTGVCSCNRPYGGRNPPYIAGCMDSSLAKGVFISDNKKIKA